VISAPWFVGVVGGIVSAIGIVKLLTWCGAARIGRLWRSRQILDDPAGDHDWGFDVEVDLEASDEEGSAVLRLVDAGRKD
jgi:hypothetical protein